ncbi:hypothetical protein RND71_040215 [Anisodus tanguticus]|uniref:AMP-binding enzyme C-terminal domain-containing protein n=1 Tax=Anisodus tanguticus TaxID=243964 RepID=A0AAE1QX71_9SOLA|nr:hypothetical protein RND71_040215 [Anisodus tanguticus]
MKEEGVGIGLVVLVKVGNVPKTTSGKIQRWLAKKNHIRGEKLTNVTLHQIRGQPKELPTRYEQYREHRVHRLYR